MPARDQTADVQTEEADHAADLAAYEGTANLDRLAAELDPGTFAAVIVRSGRSACLRISNRRASQLTEDVYAGRGFYWWSWAERIGGCDDPADAAAKVTRVLRAAGER
jgi:hypothetical protein